MKKSIIVTVIGALILSSFQVNIAQEKKVLDLDQVLELASTQSTNALMAKNRFRSSYWQYRSFKAEYLPSLTFEGTVPSYSTAFEQVYRNDEWQYVRSNLMQATGGLSLSQNIGLTGGSIAVNSSLAYQNNIETGEDAFITEPVLNIRLTQPIFKYNSLKWQKKTEPLQYEIAKKTYISNMEEVNSTAVRYFFSLALAQINVQIAEANYSNSDTLYKMSEGRYQLGTIAEDELLQMKLTWLNAETNLKQAQMNLRDQENRMRTFLGFNDNVSIELIIPDKIPNIQVDAQEVLTMALDNNPQVSQQELTILESQSNVARAKAERGLNADLVASYGLSDQDQILKNAYQNVSNSQTVRLSLSVPILDWGQRKGSYKMALSTLELAQVQSQQTLSEFEEDLLLDVEQFNLQYQQVNIAAQSDTVAQRMYEVSKARYVIGSSTVLELNNADSSKDTNRRAYIQALQTYWTYFYNVRSLAMYDFINKKPLEADFDALVD